MSSCTNVFGWVLGVIGLFATFSAHAVWNETIEIVGDAPLGAGATVTLTLDSGTTIEGEVREDRDRRVLYFELPGDGPQRGVIEISEGARVSRFNLGTHGPGDRLMLDLKKNAVDVRPTAVDTARNDWEFGIGVYGGYFASDYFSELISEQAGVLDGLLTSVGGMNNQITSNAEDDGAAGEVSIRLKRNLDQNSAVYLDAGWGRTSSFDASISGESDVSGNLLQARASGESKLEFISLELGYEHAIVADSAWRWYAGLGGLWVDLKDKSSTSLSVNGMEFDTSSASTDDDDEALFVEAGVRYRFLLHRCAFEMELGFRQTNELFNGETGSSLGVGLSAWF